MSKTNILTFKQREHIVKEFYWWKQKTNALNSLENFLSFLTIIGIIDIDKADEYCKNKEWE